MAVRPKILIFAHDGRGLGHLRRLSLIAAKLQASASVLFLTGHRDVAWLVPDGCEFVHIPSLDSLDERRSKQWGRAPFLDGGIAEGRRLRAQLINTVVLSFAPDAVILDYLPLGIDGEMQEVVFNAAIKRRYFVLRGIFADLQDTTRTVLTQTALAALRARMDLILVTADCQVVDVVQEYALPASVESKLTYVGYAVESVSQDDIDLYRYERLRDTAKRLVVCSAGGGKEGEALIARCWHLARLFPECAFNIVVGPRSRIKLQSDAWFDNGRIRLVSSETGTMNLQHAAADIVICRGGYNSLLEASIGKAFIIGCPIEGDFEQAENVRRFARFRQLREVNDFQDLDLALEEGLCVPSRSLSSIKSLDLDGVSIGAKVILADLAQSL